MEDTLETLGLSSPFHGLVADYRPKDYMARHVWAQERRQGGTPEALVFFDDHLENCKRVAALGPLLEVPVYSLPYRGRAPHDLATILGHVIRGTETRLATLVVEP